MRTATITPESPRTSADIVHPFAIFAALGVSSLAGSLSIWVQWGMTTLMLGHRPRPGPDDPKIYPTEWNIHGLTTALVLLTLYGFLPAIGILVQGARLAIGRPDTASVRHAWLALIFGSACILIAGVSLALANYGPWDVMEWWLD